MGIPQQVDVDKQFTLVLPYNNASTRLFLIILVFLSGHWGKTLKLVRWLALKSLCKVLKPPSFDSESPMNSVKYKPMMLSIVSNVPVADYGQPASNRIQQPDGMTIVYWLPFYVQCHGLGLPDTTNANQPFLRTDIRIVCTLVRLRLRWSHDIHWRPCTP